MSISVIYINISEERTSGGKRSKSSLTMMKRLSTFPMFSSSLKRGTIVLRLYSSNSAILVVGTGVFFAAACASVVIVFRNTSRDFPSSRVRRNNGVQSCTPTSKIAPLGR